MTRFSIRSSLCWIMNVRNDSTAQSSQALVRKASLDFGHLLKGEDAPFLTRLLSRHSKELKERDARLDEASGESMADRRLVDGLRKVNEELKTLKLDTKSKILDTRPKILNTKPLTLNHVPKTLNPKSCER